VCDKRELELPLQQSGVNILRAGHIVANEWLRGLVHAPEKTQVG
jgi:hypothetical protein